MSNGGHPLPAADDLSAQGLQDGPVAGCANCSCRSSTCWWPAATHAWHSIPPLGPTRISVVRCPVRTRWNASSTATSISLRGYEAAGRARGALMQAAILDGIEDAFDARIERCAANCARHSGSLPTSR